MRKKNTDYKEKETIQKFKEELLSYHTNKLEAYRFFDKNYLSPDDQKRIGDFEKIFSATEKWLNKFSDISDEIIVKHALAIFQFSMLLSLSDASLTKLARTESNINPHVKNIQQTVKVRRILEQARMKISPILDNAPLLTIGGETIEERLSTIISELELTEKRSRDSVDWPKKNNPGKRPFTNKSLISSYLERLLPFFRDTRIYDEQDLTIKIYGLCLLMNYNNWQKDLDEKNKIIRDSKNKKLSMAESPNIKVVGKQKDEMSNRHRLSIIYWFQKACESAHGQAIVDNWYKDNLKENLRNSPSIKLE